MTVVYVDSVFVLNGVMDYLLCLLTARLAGIPLRRFRYALSALAGGFYAVAVFLPGCDFLAAVPVKAAVGVVLALIAYGGEERFLRLTLLLFTSSCVMAGCVLALGILTESTLPVISGIFYTDINARTLLITATAVYLALSIVFRAAAKHGIRGERLPVRICAAGQIIELSALWDSGNGLCNPIDGKPVLIVAPGTLDCLIPGNLRQSVKKRSPAELLVPLRNAVPELRPALLPYRAVGVEGGMLLTIRTEWIEVDGVRYPELRAALSPTALGADSAALWGGSKGG